MNVLRLSNNHYGQEVMMRVGKYIFGFFMTLSAFLLVACGDKNNQRVKVSKDAAKQMMTGAKEKQALLNAKLKQRELRTAVIMLIANVGNIQGGGGYQSWTATKMADKLISLSKSAQSPPRGMPNVSHKPVSISYVKGKVTKPWQIVLIPEDRQKKIIIKAYGDNLKKPILIKEVRVSTY